MTDHPDFLNAGNAGPFTLDGTRSYLIGNRQMAVIDPGPDVEDHVRALSSALAPADEVSIVLTHGHADHAAAAAPLAAEIGAPILGPNGVEGVDRLLEHGDTVPTDEGTLIAVHTPGHTVEHLAFHLPERGALFAGDLVLGRGDTTWVAEYAGCVADYLASLDHLRTLGLSVIYPAHGPPLTDPGEALDRFEAHRRDRIRQVRDALSSRPGADIDELIDVVYEGALPSALRGAAQKSLEALLDYVTTRSD